MRAALSEGDIGALESARVELADSPPRLPKVSRVTIECPGNPTVSGLQWREENPRLVLLHGGFETAHVWDLLGITLDRPLVALDLPGCGCSEKIQSGTYWPPDTNRLLSPLIQRLADSPVALVGLSYGGLLALSLLDEIPDCISQVILLDVLPGSAPDHADRVLRWVREQPMPSTLVELEALWAKLYPNRSARFLRQVICTSHAGEPDALLPIADCRPKYWSPIPGFDRLWKTIETSRTPIVLVRAGRSRVVSDLHVERLLELRPDSTVRTVFESGHHIPLNAPEALASILEQQISRSAA